MLMDKFDRESGQASDEKSMESKRSSPRDSLLLNAMLEIRGTQVPVRVRNLSAGGLMAEYPHEVGLDEEIRIDVRGVGWVPGKIAWAVAGRIGIAFLKDIDPKLARKPVVQEKKDHNWLHVYPNATPPVPRR